MRERRCRTTPSKGVTLLLSLLCLVAPTWSGCQNSPTADSKTEDRGPEASPLRLREIDALRERLRREREANPGADLPRVDDDDVECAHVFQQVGSHPYRRAGMNGIPMMEMCAISRCTKCGQVRHECQDRLKRKLRAKRAKTRTPRSR